MSEAARLSAEAVLTPGPGGDLLRRQARAHATLAELASSAPVLNATEALLSLAHAHQLTVTAVEIMPATGRRRWNPQTGTYSNPSLPTITVPLLDRPQQFVHWCHVIGADVVYVEKGARDLAVRTTADLRGFTWRVSASVALAPGDPPLPEGAIAWDHAGPSRSQPVTDTPPRSTLLTRDRSTRDRSARSTPTRGTMTPDALARVLDERDAARHG